MSIDKFLVFLPFFSTNGTDRAASTDVSYELDSTPSDRRCLHNFGMSVGICLQTKVDDDVHFWSHLRSRPSTRKEILLLLLTHLLDLNEYNYKLRYLLSVDAVLVFYHLLERGNFLTGRDRFGLTKKLALLHRNWLVSIHFWGKCRCCL